jgi:hypothetical protein
VLTNSRLNTQILKNDKLRITFKKFLVYAVEKSGEQFPLTNWACFASFFAENSLDCKKTETLSKHFKKRIILCISHHPPLITSLILLEYPIFIGSSLTMCQGTVHILGLERCTREVLILLLLLAYGSGLSYNLPAFTSWPFS